MNFINQKLQSIIRDVPDFPKPGILFKDITPLFHYPELWDEMTEEIIKQIEPLNINAVAGVESRGFLLGPFIARKLNVPFILVRKKGKLPAETVSYQYDLEYGSAEIEVHTDSIKPNWNVLIHDDLLATGGTAKATAELVKKCGANTAAFAFIIELSFLDGSEALKAYSNNIIKLVTY